MSKSGTSGETGTGLGLIICNEFVTLNNGKIWVTSKKDIGTTVSFSVEKA
jgi:signal transduction histidine kinase